MYDTLSQTIVVTQILKSEYLVSNNSNIDIVLHMRVKGYVLRMRRRQIMVFKTLNDP